MEIKEKVTGNRSLRISTLDKGKMYNICYLLFNKIKNYKPAIKMPINKVKYLEKII